MTATIEHSPAEEDLCCDEISAISKMEFEFKRRIFVWKVADACDNEGCASEISDLKQWNTVAPCP